MKPLIALTQLVLHYLGIIGIILGLVAFVVGNEERGKTLLIGGVGFIVVKYLIGGIYLLAVKIFSKGS